MSGASPRWLQERETALLRAAAALGAVVLAAGVSLEPRRAWAVLLLAGFSLSSLSLAAAAFLAMHRLGCGDWPRAFERVPRALAACLPVGAGMLLLLFFGVGELYPWAGPGAHTLHGAKAAFLTEAGFRLRTALYLAVWLLLARRLLRAPRDRGAGASAGFLAAFGVTFSLACVDWVMSLEPHWYSTLYPWYLFSGLLVLGLAAMTLLAQALHRRGRLPDFAVEHRHDLGKYLFGFSVFWAYLWFSQYLLIWYSNLPEETAHYLARSRGAWGPLFALNPIVNLAIPFVLLLGARWKRRERTLTAACWALVLGHGLDLYLQIYPSLGTGPRFGWLECGVLVGASAGFLLTFDRALEGDAFGAEGRT